MSRWPLLLSLAAGLIAAPIHAQNATSGKEVQAKGAKTFGVFGAVNFPTSDLGDAASTGWGFGLQGIFGQGAFALIGEVGYDHFGGDTGVPAEGNFLRLADDYSYSFSPWHFGAGIRAALGPIYVAGLAGYWTDIEDFDVVPMAGIRIWKLDAGLRYKGLLGDGDWVALTVGFFFGKK